MTKAPTGRALTPNPLPEPLPVPSGPSPSPPPAPPWTLAAGITVSPFFSNGSPNTRLTVIVSLACVMTSLTSITASFPCPPSLHLATSRPKGAGHFRGDPPGRSARRIARGGSRRGRLAKGPARVDPRGERGRGGPEMQRVVQRVQREDVRVGPGDERTGDADDQVDGADEGGDDADGLAAGEVRDDQRGADPQVHHVVQRVDLEQAEQLGALRVGDADAPGHEEAGHADDQVDGAEHAGDDLAPRPAAHTGGRSGGIVGAHRDPSFRIGMRMRFERYPRSTSGRINGPQCQFAFNTATSRGAEPQHPRRGHPPRKAPV